MNYLRALNLIREPFSNTPDPDFFYQSRQHQGALNKLEIAIRLRRGLSVVIGDVGSGKTTICRQLIRRLAQEDDIETHLVLDPGFDTQTDFLCKVADMFLGPGQAAGLNDMEIKEEIKQYLFRQGVEKGKTVIMIIDEGQKTPGFCLEILREFLNYETNEFKLLQIIIFAQKEFEQVIRGRANFADRICMYQVLQPLSFKETRAMVQYRLDQARQDVNPPEIFTYAALWAVYRLSGGSPRKVINLCHLCTLQIIIESRTKVDWFVVSSCARGTAARARHRRWRLAIAVTALSGLLLAGVFLTTGIAGLMDWKFEDAFPVPSSNSNQEASVTLVSSGRAGTLEDKTTTPKQSPEFTEACPEILGSLTILPGENLCKLLNIVYGVHGSVVFGPVIRANSGLSNPDVIPVGRVIRFPSIVRGLKPRPGLDWRIEIGRAHSLEEAMALVRSWPSDTNGLRLIPYWQPGEGLVFMVILRGTYDDELTARNKLGQLPHGLAPSAQVSAEWSPDATYFAEPVRRGK